jgi:PAS domain S-box-containing protein
MTTSEKSAMFRNIGNSIAIVSLVLIVTLFLRVRAESVRNAGHRAAMAGLLASSATPLVVVNEDNRIVFFSPAATIFFGYDASAIEGQDASRLFAKGSAAEAEAKVRAIMDRAVDVSAPPVRIRAFCVTKSGETVERSAIVAPYINQGERFAQIQFIPPKLETLDLRPKDNETASLY